MMTSFSSSSSETTETEDSSITLILIPMEMQVHILTYLRAYDLPAVQQTCRFYNDPKLIHDVVSYTAEHVYGHDWAKDGNSNKGKNKNDKGKEQEYHTIKNLRNIELAVVARILSSPEPKTGFYVSKSWIKNSLLWLEKFNDEQQQQQQHKHRGGNNNKKGGGKKLSKKQQRQRDRRLSDVTVPWPDANGDIVCAHQKLQRCNAKTARARRRLMDKKAWKVLKKLYPDSTQLDSHGGECLQCLMETETARKSEQDAKESAKFERKQPLSNPLVRAFYTRTRGVPTDRLRVSNVDDVPAASASAASGSGPNKKKNVGCPLQNGTYMILPRAWCHQWRRYIKTGEGSVPLPPGSSEVLCHAHQFALIPPHLEFYLQGQTPHLLSSVKDVLVVEASSPPPVTAAAAAAAASPPPVAAAGGGPPVVPVVGIQPTTDPGIVQALMAAGIPHAEILSQQMAMMNIYQQQQHDAAATIPPQSPSTRRDSATQNDLLNRENHVVVELVSDEEFMALQETGCWPKHVSNFCVSVTVADGDRLTFSTEPCRKCDPTGSRFQTNASVKYRRKRWEPKSVESRRIPNLEY